MVATMEAMVATMDTRDTRAIPDGIRDIRVTPTRANMVSNLSKIVDM